MRLAIAEILPVSVDFVRQDPAGVMPLSRSEPLCHFPQITRLIVGVKRTALQPRPSVNDTDVQLRTKLHRLSRFSPHNGPNEGLAHADDPVQVRCGYGYRTCTSAAHRRRGSCPNVPSGGGTDFFRGTVFHRWHPGHAGGKPAASQWLCGSFSQCVYGILCISGNLFRRVCGRFEASFRPQDREEHPKAFRRSPWPR